MTNKTIAISREFGSGGRTIGRKLAAELGIPFYDMEIIERIAADGGAARGSVSEDDIWEMEKNIILEFVDRYSCVIVGRCADYILRDNPNCVKAFIHASVDKRAQHIVDMYGERKESPEKRLREKDKRRRAYYEKFTGLEWGDAKNYDVALNSGVLGINKCVEILADLYHSR